MKKAVWLQILAVAGSLFCHSGFAQIWTPTAAPSQNWLSVVSSADGTKLAAAGWYGWLYVSTNSGASWTMTATATNSSEPYRPWSGLATSADGSHLAAVANSSPIFISTNYGLTWSAHGPVVTWAAVASSANGNKLAAADYNMGRIYTSSDFGNTWTPTSSPAKRWRTIASSALCEGS